MRLLPKVVLLGDSNTGKSSLLNRFVNDEFIILESTIGAAFIEHAKFELWDTAGQERYRSLAPMYYRGAAAAIIVFDLTDEESLDGAKAWVKELRVRGEGSVVIALVGNKNDLEEQRKVRKEDAEAYARDADLLYMETSAKTGANVKQLFEDLEAKFPARRDSATNKLNGVKMNIANPPTSADSQRRRCC